MKRIALTMLLVLAVLASAGSEVAYFNTCDECRDGCAMKEYDGCNTCTYTVMCNDGEWTRQRTGICTAMDCPVIIKNPYEGVE